jgi:hypothetical protein
VVFEGIVILYPQNTDKTFQQLIGFPQIADNKHHRKHQMVEVIKLIRNMRVDLAHVFSNVLLSFYVIWILKSKIVQFILN